jgi:branched-chain amino acid transport system substrate-binding protein
MTSSQERPSNVHRPSPFAPRRSREPDQPGVPPTASMMNDINWRNSTEGGEGGHARDADENVLLRELVEQMVLPDTRALPSPGRTPRIIALVAATAIVSVVASVLAVHYLSYRAGSGAGPGTETVGRVAAAAPQFLVSPPAGPLEAEEAVPLGVAVYGTADGAEFLITGMAPGSTFSTGRAVGSDSWTIPAADIKNAMIAPPRGFVGPMDLSVELRLGNGSVVDRKASRLEWAGAVQTAQGQTRSVAASSSSGAPVAAAAPLTGGAAVRGVNDHEIRFGIAAPFSGPAKELGRQMKLGLDTAFNLTNDSGGVFGRQLRLVAADDGYEPTRTVDAVRQLWDKEQVFGMVGNVGTPTAAVALPFALEHKMLFFGAFTGASLLRRDPPDRYVFNYRASYSEETDAVVRYLVKVKRIRPEEIAVFAQQDSYGDAGFAGVAKAMRALRGGDGGAILRLNYKRNSVDVQEAIGQLRGHKGTIKAIVMVATYRAAAKFIEKARDMFPQMIFTNVSFVGSTALADELMLLGPRYATGVIVTQVVPAVSSYSTAILEYKSALAKYFPGEAPDYVSLEGYVAGSVLSQALKRTGPQLDAERVVDGFEGMRNLDMGLGTLLTFGRGEHQGSHKVWGTQLDETGQYHSLELQ